MGNQDKQTTHLSIAEAVETLSEIAETDLAQEGTFDQQEADFNELHPEKRAVYWLKKGEPEKCVEIAMETFKVVLNYLQRFYKDKTAYVGEDPALEGVKAIMVLVGDAAKKLDRHIQYFRLMGGMSILETKEYKRLQEFYQSKVAHKFDEGQLGLWVLALSKKMLGEPIKQDVTEYPKEQSRHVFVDLESVKKDVEYELFFLRKEDGSRFFSPRLLRNMKLVGDFDTLLGAEVYEDLLLDVPLWVDKYYQYTAENILKEVGVYKDRFFGEFFKYKNNELVQELGDCLIALTMAANPDNSIKKTHLKNCTKYFEDFQFFLRQALHTREYSKLVAYPPKENNKVGCCLVTLLQSLCKGLFLSCCGYQQVKGDLHTLLQTVEEEMTKEQLEQPFLWGRLNAEYELLSKMVKAHQNAPLVRVLDELQNGIRCGYDPLFQKTMQAPLYHLTYGGNSVLNLRMGCPTVQEYIDKAAVNDEFKTFLRGLSKGSTPRGILLVNLQDRTSWKENVRCAVLEELQHHEDFHGKLVVATVASETDFCHQLTPYDQDNKTQVFFEHFKSVFKDENSGYCFPRKLRDVLDEGFFNGVFHAIQQVFFGGKNMLLRNHRVDFIAIFDTLLTLKIIETVQPDCMGLLCKDGVDSGAAANAMLYCFLKLANTPENISEEEWLHLNYILHLPAMMVRERLIQHDVFDRFINALKVVEAVKQEHGAERFIKVFHDAFKPFFKTSILSSEVE